jgi:hypothetical protein
MTTFSVTFYTADRYACHDIEAATTEEALQRARQLWETDPYELDFDSYDDLQALQTISIEDPDQASSFEWATPEFTVANYAYALLDALEKALVALNEAPRFKLPSLDTDSYALASECARVIALAKGGDA